MMQTLLVRGCCTTRGAVSFWAAMFLLFYGAGLLLGRIWPEVERYGDTTILIALAAACFANFARNRTLHCGLTGPLFLLAAIVAMFVEAGFWNVQETILWALVLGGVTVAFLIEWRTVGRKA
jgi:hypothetical protein